MKRNPIPVKEAINRVVQQDIYLNTAEVKLEDSLDMYLRRILLQLMIFLVLINHLMTGLLFEVKILFGACSENRKQFKVIDHIGAGSVSEKILGQNEAVRIMTGAQIPEGADAVVMFEQTVEDGDTFTIRKSFEANENVSLKGEETTTGDIVLKKVKSLIQVQ